MHIENIQKIIECRKILERELYIGHTLITYDLILDILHAHLEGKSSSIKELCAVSIRSTLNTRKHINSLQRDGLVEFSNGVHDKRLRLVTATPKLIHLVDDLLNGWSS